MARIVLVDDSKMSRMFLKNILVAAGHEIVAEGANGLEGFDLYRQHRPDVITLDMVMPILTGTDCLKQIMAFDPKANAVMITSLGKDSFIEESKALGARAIVVKPIKDADVLAAVEAAMAVEYA